MGHMRDKPNSDARSDAIQKKELRLWKTRRGIPQAAEQPLHRLRLRLRLVRGSRYAANIRRGPLAYFTITGQVAGRVINVSGAAAAARLEAARNPQTRNQTPARVS